MDFIYINRSLRRVKKSKCHLSKLKTRKKPMNSFIYFLVKMALFQIAGQIFNEINLQWGELKLT